MCSLKQKIAAATEAPPPLSPWQPNSRSPLYSTQESSEQKRMRSILISHSLKQNSMKLAFHGVSRNFYEYSRIWVKELTSIHRGIILSLSFKYIQMLHKHTFTCRINRKRKYTFWNLHQTCTKQNCWTMKTLIEYDGVLNTMMTLLKDLFTFMKWELNFRASNTRCYDKFTSKRTILLCLYDECRLIQINLLNWKCKNHVHDAALICYQKFSVQALFLIILCDAILVWALNLHKFYNTLK